MNETTSNTDDTTALARLRAEETAITQRLKELYSYPILDYVGADEDREVDADKLRARRDRVRGNIIAALEAAVADANRQRVTEFAWQADTCPALLWEHIRNTRATRTLKEVSEGTGYSVSFLADVEAGRSTGSVDFLIRLANYYGVSMVQFLKYVNFPDDAYAVGRTGELLPHGDLP